MKIETLLQDIEPKWHSEFIQFVKTGEASPEFLHYLDRDKRGQSAVERAFTAQVETLQGLAQVIKRTGRVKLRAAPPTERPAEAIARAVERVVELPGNERREELADAAATLTRRVDAEGAREVRSTLSELEHAVATLMK